MHAMSAETARAEAASYRPTDFREKVVGAVASVVFTREGSPGGGSAAVSVVFEGGAWKIRTYPGIFPGGLLAEAKLGAARARKG